MKKILPLLIIGIFLLNSFSVIVISEKDELKQEIIQYHFSKPEIMQINGYNEIRIEGVDSVYYHSGKPLLPMVTKTFHIPFMSEITDISIDVSEVKNIAITEKIKPAPTPQIRGMQTDISEIIMDKTTYSSNNYIPENWYSYQTGGGRDKNGLHKTFLTIQIYPVLYNPASNNIKYIEEIELIITYKEPSVNPFPTTSSYDMVIIAPSIFSNELQRLIGHKNAHGVRTTLKTLESIYSEYEGYDKPEQIKYFIKDALDSYYIKYVLLVGGMKSVINGDSRDDCNQGTKDWHFPVRYTNLYDNHINFDPGFISDLYFADIYDSEGGFSTWDFNNDGIFGGWVAPPTIGDSGDDPGDIEKDIIDLYADLSVGRIPCRNTLELKIMINKIIDYERTKADPSWFNRMVVIAGDPYPDPETNFIEGELIGDKALSYMSDFEAVRLYASNKNIKPEYTPRKKNIIRELTAGSGHVLFDGHASPVSWNTFWVGDFRIMIVGGGIKIWDFPRIKNDEKQPVVVMGGCHSSLFNVTLFATITDKDNSKFMWSHGRPIPECFSWCLTRKANGGAIATLGCTGLGYEAGDEYGDLDADGINEPDCVEKLGGYQERIFYKNIDEGTGILGDAWLGTINDYLETFPGMEDLWDAKVVEQWVIIGDPSLKIGGYP